MKPDMYINLSILSIYLNSYHYNLTFTFYTYTFIYTYHYNIMPQFQFHYNNISAIITIYEYESMRIGL